MTYCFSKKEMAVLIVAIGTTIYRVAPKSEDARAVLFRRMQDGL